MAVHYLPNNPFAQFLAIVPLFDRSETGDAIEILIAKLDALDGDPDLEDATGAEDAFEAQRPDGPGCPIADAGELCGDETDGNIAEDEPCAWFALICSGPGCVVSDSDTGAEDEGERDGY